MQLRWKKNKPSAQQKKFPITGDPSSDLDNLISSCKENLEEFDENLIRKAFRWCILAHENNMLRNGKPYYTHPLSLAHIVIAEIPLDEVSVIAALLHSVLSRKTRYSYKDIQLEFGKTVAEIVDGMGKMRYVQDHNIEQMENYRKLLLSLFKDVRIILLKIADSVDNMRTLQFLPPEKQKQTADETIQIYVPFANRFGLGSLKWEMEDLAFKYHHPAEFKEIRSNLELSLAEREQYLDDFIAPIKKRLQEDKLLSKRNLSIEINGRAKHIYSIYNKMRIRGLPMNELYDLFAVRLILDTEEVSNCYAVYGIIADIYNLVPETYKNYIAKPKKNGYRSIHSAFFGKDKRAVEVQVRTKEMHFIAEHGVASHFNYKRGALPAQTVLDNENLNDWVELVRTIFQKVGNESVDELLDSVRTNSFRDEIYVFTPLKEFRVLPKGSTPVDFAFSVHTEVGMHCIGAKSNGKIIPLDYKLRSGEQIEILTSDQKQPNKEWLKSVVTHRAKSQVHKYLKDIEDDSEAKGRKIWDNIVSKLELDLSYRDLTYIVNSLNYSDIKQFFIELSKAGMDIGFVSDYVKEVLAKREKKSKKKKKKAAKKKNKGKKTVSNHLRKKYINIEYAACCSPIPGDKIVGEILPDKVVIHRNECLHVKQTMRFNKSNVVSLEWDSLAEEEFDVKIIIKAAASPSLINDITKKLALQPEIKINGLNFNTKDDEFKGVLDVSLSDAEDYILLKENLIGIESVKSVSRGSEV